MKKQIIVIGMTLMLVAIGLSGCTTTKTNADKILGEWAGPTPAAPKPTVMHFHFNPNGNLSITAATTHSFENVTTQTRWATYAITENTLAIDYYGNTDTLEYSFSNNDNTLTLIGDEQLGLLILTRQ